MNLEVTFGPLTLRNPVVAVSGTFAYGEEYEGLVDLSGLGAIITKTVTVAPRPGNPPPRLAETPCGLLNSIGLTNVGYREFLRKKLPALAGCGTQVIVNVAGRDAGELALLAREVGAADGVAAIELNLSCPNVTGGMDCATDAAATEEAVRGAVRATKTPVIAKLSPNVTDIAEIAAAAARGGAAGISLINTLVGMSVDVETRRSKLGTNTGGLSGPAIRPVAVAQTWKVARAVAIPVLGMGGVVTARDALEFLIVGASAVGVGTATFRDPGAMTEIVAGIGRYLESHAIERVADLVGTYLPSPVPAIAAAAPGPR
jgi:dihydroorotate dehydrogenase (NAD+) catalytic subunit